MHLAPPKNNPAKKREPITNDVGKLKSQTGSFLGGMMS